ncbi:DUF1499 domain-containing protein [Mangrovicella endophytica]|uniref:DUF1499 domain-containing protein n=1 Tax=Mangrovicella endophytica TaxID=2066697 RepID=UPI000C9DC3A1|nr:DUF1499 domain-containing protein [Mangrovicella endophytica]
MSVALGRIRPTGHYLRKRLRLAGLARRLAAFSLVLLLVALGFFRLGSIGLPALQGSLALALALAVVAALIGLGGLFKVWRTGAEGGGRAVGAFALALVVLAPFSLAGVLAYDNPATNVAATDGMADAAPDPVAAVIARAGADTPAQPLTGRRFDAAAPTVYGAARLVLADEGWTIGTVTAGDPLAQPEEDVPSADLGRSGTGLIPVPTPRTSIDRDAEEDPLDQPDADQYAITAVAHDVVFGLPSDIEIRIMQDDAVTFVDIRSTSRSTKIDLGQNRRFIEDFLTRLDEAMATTGTLADDDAD